MKKILALILSVIALLSLGACFGGSEEPPAPGPNTYGIRISETANGSIDVGGKYLVTEGDSLTVRFTPISGYRISRAYYTDASGEHDLALAADGTATIHNILSDIELHANFEPDTAAPEVYSITALVIPDGGGATRGTITLDKSQVNDGETVTVTATPVTDYRLGRMVISANGAQTEVQADEFENSEYTFTPTANTVISVSFVAITAYNATIEVEGGGTASLSATEISPGGNVTINFTADPHCELNSLIVNEVERISEIDGGRLIITGVHSDLEIKLVFATEQHSVSVTATQFGTTTVSKNSVGYGEKLVITCTPDSGYMLYALYINGAEYDGRLPFSGDIEITVTGDITIRAEYAVAKTEVGLNGVVRYYGSYAPVPAATVEIRAGNTLVKTLTTSASGEFSTTLEGNEYTIRVLATGAVADDVPVSLRYDDENITVVVSEEKYLTSGNIVYGFDGNENFEILGNGIALRQNYLSEYAILEGEFTIPENGYVGFSVGNSGFFGFSRGGYIGRDGSDSLFSNYHAFPSGTAKARLVRRRSSYALFIDDGSGYEFVASASRANQTSSSINGAKRYGVAAENLVGETSVRAFRLYDDRALIDSTMLKEIVLERNAFGSVVLYGDVDGRAEMGSTFYLDVSPLSGYSMGDITLNGNPIVNYTGVDGFYTYNANTASIGGDKFEVVVNFVRDPSASMVEEVSDGYGAGNTYDTTLFYRNDLEINGADPGVMYVSPEEDATYGGWFYMAVTGSGSGRAFPIYRSRDLARWESCGEGGYALTTTSASWTNDCYWAPELIRDPVSKKYFIFFSARSKVGTASTDYNGSTATVSGDSWDRLYIGIGMSSTPMGPYTLVTAADYYGEGTTTNLNGDRLNESTPPINFGKQFAAQLATLGSAYTDAVTGHGIWPAIDASPFFASNGDLYLYFSQHISSAQSGNHIWGLKMRDMVTPDWSTLTKLLSPYEVSKTATHEYTGTPGSILPSSWSGSVADGAYDGTINEGAFVIENEGKFYLTYSPFGYGSRRYSIMQSVGDSPLGPFTKLSRDYANPVIGIGFERDEYDFMAGAGHHSFVRAGDEIFAVYHAFYNPINNNENGAFMGRAIGFDRVSFVDSAQYGFKVLRGDGATYSLQPLPEVASGYGNIANTATVTISSSSSAGRDYLTDNRFSYQPFEEDLEFESTGDTDITFTFSEAHSIRAVMAYTGFNFTTALKSINEVVLTLADGSTASLGKVEESRDEYINYTASVIRPGGSLTVDFAEIEVTAVTLKVRPSSDKASASGNIFRLSEIKILGKKSDSAATSPVYSIPNGSTPSKTFALDGVASEPEWKGGNNYSYTSNGITVTATTHIDEYGVYVYAQSLDPNVVWAEKNKFTLNTHFRLYFATASGGYTYAYVDEHNYRLYGSRITASASRTNGGLAIEAYIGWAELGYAAPPETVRVLPAYYAFIDSVGKVLLPDRVTVAAVTSYPVFGEGGAPVEGNGIWGSSPIGEAATQGTTYIGNEIITESTGRREVWYTPLYADNFVISLDLSVYGSGSVGIMYADDTTRLNINCADESAVTLVKTGDTLVVLDSENSLMEMYTVSTAAGYVGVYSVGVSLGATATTAKSYTTVGGAIAAVGSIAAIPTATCSTGGRVSFYTSGNAVYARILPISGYELSSVIVGNSSNKKSEIADGVLALGEKGSAYHLTVEFTPIVGSFEFSGSVTKCPLGEIAEGARVRVISNSGGGMYAFTIGADGRYSLTLSTADTYSVIVSLDGYIESKYALTASHIPSLHVTAPPLGYSVNVAGTTLSSTTSSWDYSAASENSYTATQNEVVYFEGGVGNNALIRFTIANKTDTGSMTEAELINSTTEYDPAVGIVIHNGSSRSLVALWRSGYRVQLDMDAAWTGTNVISTNPIDSGYNLYTYGNDGSAHSFVFIRRYGNYYLFYEKPDGTLVKIYDSEAAGHTFAASGNEVAFGLGFTSSKTFDIRFTNLSILLDSAAYSEIYTILA